MQNFPDILYFPKIRLCPIIKSQNFTLLLCPPLKKEGHIALHMSVGMSVGRYVGIP